MIAVVLIVCTVDKDIVRTSTQKSGALGIVSITDLMNCWKTAGLTVSPITSLGRQSKMLSNNTFYSSLRGIGCKKHVLCPTLIPLYT